MANSIHVVPDDGDWAVKQAGRPEPISNATTQAEAARIGRMIAKVSESELIIHKKNGQFGTKNSYGKDPFPPRG